jgi:MFS family permease
VVACGVLIQYAPALNFSGAFNSVRDVWIITIAIITYGVANGCFVTATPQASLNLGLVAEKLGLIGAGLPLGYVLSCLIFGQLLANIPGKYVLMAGASCGAASMYGMSLATTTTACVAAQICYGIACGAFWPFASAWLLDFQREGIARARLLRHYNVAWTSGTAAGMLIGGWTCEQKWVTQTLAGAAVLACVAVLLASTARKTQPARGTVTDGSGKSTASAVARIGFPIFVAACISNLTALVLRGIELNNYAELNKAQGFDAARMGLLSAILMVAQVSAFFISAQYERWLGLRRVYVALAASVVGIALGLAYVESLPVLIALMILHGFVNAIGFQAGLLASTGYFSRARTGTTFHEAVVGFAIMSPLPAGWIVATTEPLANDPHFPLRAPILAAAGVAVLGLVIQLILVGRNTSTRLLLPDSANK